MADVGDPPKIAESRKPFAGGLSLRGIVLLVAIAALGALIPLVGPGARQRADLDDDLCPPQAAITASSTFLVDGKPLDEPHLTLPGNLLRDAARELGANAELRVIGGVPDADAPWRELGRVCKPYDNADLQVDQAKDQRAGDRDCDDVPAQLPVAVRDAARLFCDRRDALADRADAFAADVRPTVDAAYLVEALEETVLDLNERPAPRHLLLLSDMVQHAPWYSHLALGWRSWHFDDFVDHREARDRMHGPRPAVDGIDVTVYLVPRRGMTDPPQAKRALLRFWHNYFDGARISFSDQPTMSSYPASAADGIGTAEERSRLMLERMQIRVAEERQRLGREAQRLADREAELVRREQALERQTGPTAADGEGTPQ